MNFFKKTLFVLLLLGSHTIGPNDFLKYDEKIEGSELSITMVPIEGGNYLQGSDDRENPDEYPAREVEVSDFWMSTLEITWDQFEVFLYRETDTELSEEGREIELDIDGISGATMPYVNFNKPGLPLINVTQYAASTFCKWLSAKTGHFYRLPTEAEWEYACRAGSTTVYSFSDPQILDDYAWHSGNSNAELKKGGQKSPNDFGLYDMHGNAAEWVIDAYDKEYYANRQESKDPVNFPDKLYPRVVRGGSFNDDITALRSSARQFSDKSWKRRDPQIPKSLWWMTDATHVGFRIVRPRTIPPKSEWEKYWGKPIKEY